MAASGATPIILFHSTTAAAVPSNTNLAPGELAVNIADMKLYAENSSGVVTLLADAAAQGTVTSVDVSGGTTGLTTSGGPVTTSGTITLAGTLAVANGGTGATSLTANNVVLGNGTSAVQFVAPGTSGNVLTSNGTTWTSAAGGGGLTGTTDSASPFETALGTGAGAVNTGANNVFVGFEAGNDNTTGADNTAVGYQALDINTTGGGNTAVGCGALGANTTGDLSVAVGIGALLANTTGIRNTAVGRATMQSNTTGGCNVAVGVNSLAFNTTGNDNIAIGNGSLFCNTTGSANVGIPGLDSITTGSSNVAVKGLTNATTGCFNVSVGEYALSCVTTGSNNIGIGTTAGRTGPSPDGIVNLTTESNRIVMGNNDHTCAQIKIAWTATSDCRDKTCFAPIALGLDFVRALKPTEYQFKQGGRDSTATDGKRRYGFLAQEMLPLEGDNPVIISADDPDKLQYTEAHLIPVLVKAIQELTARVEQLENA